MVYGFLIFGVGEIAGAKLRSFQPYAIDAIIILLVLAIAIIIAMIFILFLPQSQLTGIDFFWAARPRRSGGRFGSVVLHHGRTVTITIATLQVDDLVVTS